MTEAHNIMPALQQAAEAFMRMPAPIEATELAAQLRECLLAHDLDAVSTNAPVMQGVAVKQLEWFSNTKGGFYAGTIFGRFAVIRHGGDGIVYRPCLGGIAIGAKYYESPEVAKAAAQSRYETLVRSQLTTPPEPQGWRSMDNDPPKGVVVIYLLSDTHCGEECISGCFDGEDHHAFDGASLDHALGWMPTPPAIKGGK